MKQTIIIPRVSEKATHRAPTAYMCYAFHLT